MTRGTITITADGEDRATVRCVSDGALRAGEPARIGGALYALAVARLMTAVSELLDVDEACVTLIVRTLRDEEDG